MKITCSHYWPRDESWWPHVPSEGNKSGDVSVALCGGVRNRKVDIQDTYKWNVSGFFYIGYTNLYISSYCGPVKKKRLLVSLRSLLSPRVNQTSDPQCRLTPPLMLHCWQTGISHGITHQAWISHSWYSSNANALITPHAEGWPLFWKGSVQIPCLVTPTSFSSLCLFLFHWPPCSRPSTPHLAWEPTPVALPRHHHHTLCLH